VVSFGEFESLRKEATVGSYPTQTQRNHQKLQVGLGTRSRKLQITKRFWESFSHEVCNTIGDVNSIKLDQNWPVIEYGDCGNKNIRFNIHVFFGCDAVWNGK
jgi:hypothetical protein